MRSIVALLAIGVMLAACGSASPSASTPAPTTAPGTAGPTTAPTQPGATDGATSSAPSLVPDTTLEAAFPDQIDGQPVTGVTSGSYLTFMQEWTTQTEIDAYVAAMQSIGVNPALVSLGGASATIGGETVTISALHVPGGSAAAVAEKMVGLSKETPPVYTTGNLGGKPVTISTTVSDGYITYLYFNGEFVWSLSMDEAQAAVVLAALP